MVSKVVRILSRSWAHLLLLCKERVERNAGRGWQALYHLSSHRHICSSRLSTSSSRTEASSDVLCSTRCAYSTQCACHTHQLTCAQAREEACLPAAPTNDVSLKSSLGPGDPQWHAHVEQASCKATTSQLGRGAPLRSNLKKRQRLMVG